MDALAEQHRESSEVMQPPPFFSSEKAQILLGGMPITQGFHQQLRLHLQGGKLQQYIMGKQDRPYPNLKQSTGMH